MTKFLIIIITILSIGAGIANGKNLFSNDSLLETTIINCTSDNVLNCVETSGHHVYEVDKVCPLGGETFKALELGTHSTYGRHLDWEPMSYMRFPVPLAVCPTNGFVITKEKYSKEELESQKKVVESKAYRDLYGQKHATYFLFAKTNEMQKEKSDNLWWLYLNATWEADNCKNDERYKEYALETISAGKKRLAELKESEPEYWVLKVVTANMYRRIGDFKSAQSLIDEFGKPALKDKGANEYYMLALKLLTKAVKEKNTDRIPIREAEKEEKKQSDS